MPHCLLSLKKPFLLMLLALIVALPVLAQSQASEAQQNTKVQLSWDRTPGVNRYRLQVSKDEQFSDLVFDSAIEGLEYIVTDLPPGMYLWRVAPAAAETGTFSKPRRIKVKSGAKPESDAIVGARTPNATPAGNTGWFAATGNISQPITFYLRDQAAPDVVGVNTDGMVYAINATNGVALWSSRFRPNAQRGEPTGNSGAAPFQPLAFGASGGLENVLVAVEGGVWAREGATGRVLWRAILPGRAASAVAGDLNGDGTMEIAVFQDNPLGLSILDAGTGKGLAHANIDSASTGAPAAFVSKTEQGLFLALTSGTLDVRNMKGERVRSNKLDVKFTTPPLIVQAQQGTLAMLGTDRGLIAIDVSNLKPLWRVATEGDAPRGQLAAADMDNDGAPEVIMITRRGRTVVVSTATGKIKWYANIPNRAGTVTLTDLNNDGSPDVLVASDATSVTAHDGRSGALLFGDEKAAIKTTGTAEEQGENYQTCAYTGNRTGNSAAPLVVCNDTAGRGLRAVGLPSIK